MKGRRLKCAAPSIILGLINWIVDYSSATKPL